MNPLTFGSSLLFSFIFVLLTTEVSMGQEAQNAPSSAIKEKRSFRLSSKPKPQPELSEERSDKLPPGAASVGLVKEEASLPPELLELGKEATIAATNGKWDVAKEKYLLMVEKAPENALAYANLGVAEHQLGNRFAAQANLSKSLKINPSISQNWQTLGLIQYESGELSLALSSLARAIHEDPKNGTNRLFLAAIVRDYGWEDAALKELQRAIQLDPTLADAHFNLALTYFSMSPPKLELARRHYYAATDLGAEPSPELEKAFKISE